MNIAGKSVLLRAVEERDLIKLHEWSNDPGLQSLLGGWHFPVSARDQNRWYEGLSVNSTDQRFIIDYLDRGAVGTANIVSIDWQNRTAFHGILIGDRTLHGKGVAADAVATIMKYAFEELGLERLDSDIIEYNIASIKFYTEKCGWKVEGRRAGWYYRRGRRWDKILIGITRAQFEDSAA